MGKNKESRRRPLAERMAAFEANRHALIDLSMVRVDGGTQPREELDAATVEEYAEAMVWSEELGCVVDHQKEEFAPITVYFDATDYWLADGFHRREAALRAGIEDFQVNLLQGELRDAVLYSLKANAMHGKRRTNADKRRAVVRALTDPVWTLSSDRQISKMCKVSHVFVSKVRRELIEDGEIEDREFTEASDGRMIPVKSHLRSHAGVSKQTVVKASPEPQEDAPETVTSADVDDGDATLKLPAGLPRVTFANLAKLEDGTHGALLAAPHGWSDLRALHDDGLRVAHTIIYPIGQGRSFVEGVGVWFAATRDGDVHVAHRQLAEGLVLVASRERIGALTGSTLEELAAELGDGDAARVGGGA